MSDRVGSGRRTVVAYHAVGACPHGDGAHECICTSPEMFAAHMGFLSRHRQVVGLRELIEGRVGGARPAVAITFDDGYRNVLTTALPVLERHGFTATVFVPTKWIGGTNRWDAGRDCFPLEIMGETDLRALERRGIAVESHGHAHIDLETAPASEVDDDVRTSFLRLRRVLGREPRFLAYPYGRHSPAAQHAARTAGFAGAFLFDGVEAGPYAHERVSVDGLEGRVRYGLKTGGRYLARRHSALGRRAAGLIRAIAPRPEDR